MDKKTALDVLNSLIERIDTQDNRGTAAPFLHLLRIQRRQFVPECGGGGGWWGPEDDWEVGRVQADDAEMAAAMLKKRYSDNFNPDDLIQYDAIEWWETENAFLTQEGLERHMAANGHNIKHMGEHQDYMIHAYRNRELSEVIEAIRTLVSSKEE